MINLPYLPKNWVPGIKPRDLEESRWGYQAKAINKIFSDFGKLTSEVEGDTQETTEKRKKLLVERSYALKAQQEAFVVQEELIAHAQQTIL
jgi:hypothetical protein